MKREILNGAAVWDSIYNTPSSPNLYLPLPPESMIERKGEKFLWLRMMPAMQEPGNLTLPDSNKGYIPTYEKTRKVLYESVSIYDQTPNQIKTSFSPIHSIERLEILRDEHRHGGNIKLVPKKFFGNVIQIEPNAEFIEHPYMQVNIDYTVKTYETIKTDYIHTDNDNILRPELNGNLLIKVNEIWVEVGQDKWEQVKSFGFDYTKIRLSRVYEKGRNFKLSFDIISPIAMGYRTIDGKDEYLNDKSLGVQVGDLEAIISPHINISKGDIVISTVAIHTEKEVAYKGEDGRYCLKYLPVAEVYHVLNHEKEFTDSEYIVEDQRYIRFTNLKPYELPIAVSVLYGFHPAYRVTNQVSISGLNQKQQPKKFILKPDFSNVAL